METKQLTAAELFKLTKNELLKKGFTKLTLIRIERVWSYLEKYLLSKSINYFSLDLGIAFLKERYRIKDLSNLSSTNLRHLRAIQLLDDFQTHRTISIRKKAKKYKFALPFEPTFRTKKFLLFLFFGPTFFNHAGSNCHHLSLRFL